MYHTLVGECEKLGGVLLQHRDFLAVFDDEEEEFGGVPGADRLLQATVLLLAPYNNTHANQGNTFFLIAVLCQHLCNILTLL